jgi:exosortase
MRVSREWQRHALLMAIAVVLTAMMLPVIRHAVQVWSENDDLRFGFLLAPTAAWLIWRSRGSLRTAVDWRGGGRASLVCLIGALVGYLVCQRVEARSPAALAAGAVVWASVWYLTGTRVAWLVAFPIGLVTYGLALQPTLVAPLGFTLQGFTARSAESMSHLIGLNIVREGLVLRGDMFAFIVAEPCSGMNSLLALLCLAAVWTYLVRGTIGGRAAVLASVVPLTIAANTTRVVLVLLVANFFGQDSAEGFFHEASSLVLFGLAMLGMLVVSRMVGCRTLVAVAV